MISSIRNLFYLVDFPVKAKMVIAVLGSLTVSLLEILGVLATYPLLLAASGQAIDAGILGRIAAFVGISERQDLIMVLAGIIIVAFVGKTAYAIGFRWWQVGFIQRLERTARVKLLGLYLDAPYQDHKKRDLSKLHTNLATAVAQGYSQSILSLLNVVTGLVTVLLMLGVLVFVSPLVALFAITIFAVVGYCIPLLLKKRLSKISLQITEADYVSWFSAMPALSAFREMRLFGVAQNFKESYAVGAQMRAKANREQAVINELPKNIIEIVFIVSIAVLATYMFSTKNQAEAVATMGVFTVAAVRIMPALTSTIASVNAMRAGSAGVRIINEEISYFRGQELHSQVDSPGLSFDGDISVEDVVFKYSPEEPAVLDKVSLTIPARSTVAFVGSSGSGKSTLVDLILGMLTPVEGNVRCGEHNIREDIKSWHQQAGVVPQSVYILPASLKENVAFGLKAEEIDDQRVLEALEQAELGELVASLPAGIEEELGHEGGRLSGGQRQRLGIARALYRNPKLLVLDEATSALDNKTEHKITQTIDRLSGEMTIIMVAHRLSTIKKADIIFYMKNGRVINQGSFEELSTVNQEFRELVELGKLS